MTEKLNVPGLPMVYGLGISLLLHCSLVLPWLLSNRAPRWPRTPTTAASKPLFVTVVGIVSGHQVEAARLQTEAVGAPLAPQRPSRQPAPSRAPPQPRPQALLERSDRPTPPDPEKAKPDVAAPNAPGVQASFEPAPPTPPLPAPSADAPVSDEARVQQTVQSRAAEKDAVRKYVAGLSRAIQNKLVYPREARAAASIGSSVIAFTLTEQGEIVPSSLRVQRSSGVSMLDEAALRAALTGAPFPPPPERMDIAITVSFAQQE